MRAFRFASFRMIAVYLPVMIATLMLWSCQKDPEEQTTEKKTWKLNMIKFEELRQTQDAEKGFREGLAAAGLVEGQGKDYVIVSRDAQSDNNTLLSHIDASTADGTDMIVSLQSSTLHAVVKRGEGLPVVFMVVANPFEISTVGKSDTDHLPYLTGVYTNTTFEAMMGYIKACLPNARSIGTLYAQPEIDGRFYRGQLLNAAAAVNLKLESIGVFYKSSVPQSTQALIDLGIDAICQIEDNLTSASFASMIEVARTNKVPVFSFVNEQADLGSVIVVAPNYVRGAHKAANLAVAIIRGEKPAALPFERIEEFNHYVNLKAARESGITIPQDILDRADFVIGKDE